MRYFLPRIRQRARSTAIIGPPAPHVDGPDRGACFFSWLKNVVPPVKCFAKDFRNLAAALVGIG